MFEQTSGPEPVLWKTALAVIVSIVASSIISSIVAIVMGIVNLIFQNHSEWFRNMLEQLVGGALGVYAAVFICNRFLNPYSKHVVFTVLVIVIVSAVVAEYYIFHGTQWRLATQTANAVSTTIAAYIFFWRGVPIDD